MVIIELKLDQNAMYKWHYTFKINRFSSLI